MNRSNPQWGLSQTPIGCGVWWLAKKPAEICRHPTHKHLQKHGLENKLNNKQSLDFIIPLHLPRMPQGGVSVPAASVGRLRPEVGF